MIDLSAAHRAVVERILLAHLQNCRVYVFGSRAGVGRAQKYSDLDLAIEAEGLVARRCLENLREDFSASDLPILVDLVDLASTDESFRADVLARGQLIFPPR